MATYGIKYPFTCNNNYGDIIDMNYNTTNQVVSEILHILLTPIGTRLHHPTFGCNLIKYIFEPNDNETWEKVKIEASEAISRYMNGVTLNKIEVLKNDEDDNGLFLYLKYSIKKGNTIENNEVGVKL